jgi:hypothetical protein
MRSVHWGIGTLSLSRDLFHKKILTGNPNCCDDVRCDKHVHHEIVESWWGNVAGLFSFTFWIRADFMMHSPADRKRPASFIIFIMLVLLRFSQRTCLGNTPEKFRHCCFGGFVRLKIDRKTMLTGPLVPCQINIILRTPIASKDCDCPSYFFLLISLDFRETHFQKSVLKLIWIVSQLIIANTTLI